MIKITYLSSQIISFCSFPIKGHLCANKKLRCKFEMDSFCILIKKLLLAVIILLISDHGHFTINLSAAFMCKKL